MIESKLLSWEEGKELLYKKVTTQNETKSNNGYVIVSLNIIIILKDKNIINKIWINTLLGIIIIRNNNSSWATFLIFSFRL